MSSGGGARKLPRDAPLSLVVGQLASIWATGWALFWLNQGKSLDRLTLFFLLAAAWSRCGPCGAVFGVGQHLPPKAASSGSVFSVSRPIPRDRISSSRAPASRQAPANAFELLTTKAGTGSPQPSSSSTTRCSFHPTHRTHRKQLFGPIKAQSLTIHFSTYQRCRVSAP